MCENVETMLTGDMETGKAVLRDYIKAAIGFTALAEGVGTAAKSLIRMFGPKGNPNAGNLFEVPGHLQKPPYHGRPLCLVRQATHAAAETAPRRGCSLSLPLRGAAI
ncbi:MAG: hypothetical protein ACLQIQ_02975 [Beijerinckiaceae bacterium]